MIRFLRAFAWLRWRLLLNGVRGSRRRDTLEQISRLLALIVPALIVVMSLGSVLMVSAAGYLGGYALASGQFAAPREIVLVARGLLLVVTALVVFMPVGGAAQTTSTKYSRLLLLPIPARGLHLVEVLAGLADPWILFVLPGLVLFGAGLAVGGWFGAAALTLAAGAAMAALLASLGALVSFLVSWLFRDRRRAELLTVVFIMAISAVALLPQFLGRDQIARRRADERAGRPKSDMTLARFEASLPAWTQALPSEMYGRVVTRAVEGESRAAVGWIGALAGEAALLFWLSGLVHRRLLESAGGSSSRRRRAVGLRRPWRMPGVSAQATAVAWVMVRTGLRSVRGRIAVLLPGPMLALVVLVMLRTPEEASWMAMVGRQSHLAFGASLLFVILGIQPFTMNQFASDRTGLTQQWLLPISEPDLVRGKAIGGGVLFVLAMLVSCVAVSLAIGGGSLVAWAMMAVGGLAIYVTITPAAALLSAWLPVAADLSKPGSGGNPHTASALLGMLLVLVAAVPVAVIAAAPLLPVPAPAGSLIVMLVWLVVVTAIAWPLLGVAARAVTARRENLFLTIAK